MQGRLHRYWGKNERLLLITVSTVLVMSGQGIITPVLPLFAAQFGAGVASVGLTLSIFGLARLLLNVPLGLLSDRYGRRLLLVAGPLVSSVGMIGSGLAPDIPQLLGWRFLAGAGSAMYMTGAAIYLADISTPANRGHFVATNQGALLVGVSLGPAIGGLVADSYGLHAPFLLVGLATLVASLYGYVRLPETRPELPAERDTDSHAPRAQTWLRQLGSTDFLAVSAVTASVFLTRAAGRMTLMPLLAAASFGYSAGELGIVFAVMALINLLGLAPAAMLIDRLGRKWAIVPSGLVVALGLVLLAGSASNLQFLLAALVVALGTTFWGPAPTVYAADIAAPELRGLALGLNRSAGDAGMVLGPVLLGALADATSIGWALAANALLVLLACTAFGLGANETLKVTTPASEHRGRAA